MDYSIIIDMLLEPINLFVTITMSILFLVSLLLHFLWKWKIKDIFSVSKVKNYLTILWMLWTFIWIMYWLLKLNTHDISNSIQNLLDWLKTAFFTSITWLSLSLILSFICSFKVQNESNWLEEDIWKMLSEIEKLNTNFSNWLRIFKESFENILNKIDDGNKFSYDLISKNNENKEIFEDILNQNKELNSNISNISNKIKNDEILNKIENFNSKNTEEIEKLREVFSNKQEELKEQFKEFTDEMAKNNVQALIEAVEQVMKDFNTKINDQLWQSFQDLKGAIDNLLLWQTEYKENIVSQTENLNSSKEFIKEASENMVKSKNLFEDISQKSEIFTWISKSLWDELKNLNNSLDILKNWLNEFDKIAENNKEASQKIINSIDSLKNNFVSKAENIIDETENHIKTINERFKSQEELFSKAHKEILEKMKEDISENNRQNWEQLNEVIKTLWEQATKLDEELQRELNNSLESLWKEITTIAKAFTMELDKLNDILKQ